MPTYEYECEQCGRIFTRVEHIADHGDRTPKCPGCQSTKTHQLTSTFFAKTVRKS